MKKSLLFLASLLIISCGSFQHSSYKIKSVLAITEAGDTIAVPMREFERNKYDNYTRFNYNNNWYNNNWYWNNWRFQQPFFGYTNQYGWDKIVRNISNNRGYRTQAVKPKPRPNTVPTRLPQRPKNTPRTNNTQTRVNVGRNSNGKSRKN